MNHRVVLLAAFALVAKSALPASGQTPETDSLRLVPPVGHSSYITSGHFSPDDRYIATTSLDGTARVWETGSGREIRTLGGHMGSELAAWFPDSRRLVTESISDAYVWDVHTGKQLFKLVAIGDGLAVSPDGRIIAVPRTTTILLHDGVTGALLRRIEQSSRVESMSFIGTELLVTANDDKSVRVYAVNTGQQIHQFSIGSEDNLRVAAAPGGTHVIVLEGNRPNHVAWLFDVVSGRRLAKVAVGAHATAGFADQHAIIAAGDGMLWRIALQTGSVDKAQRSFRGSTEAISSDASLLLTSTQARGFELWDLSNDQLIRSFGEGGGYVTAGEFLPNADEYFAFGTRALFVIDARTGRSTTTIRADSGSAFEDAVVMADGTQFLSVTRRGIMQRWDAETGHEIARTSAPAEWASLANNVALPRTGDRVLVNSFRDKRQKCALYAAGEARKLAEHECTMYGAAPRSFSPDGSVYFLLQEDGADLRRSADGSLIHELRGVAHPWAGRFSEDGARLAVCTHSRLKLFDVATGAEIMTINAPGPEGEQFKCVMTFSHDGYYLAVSLRNYDVAEFQTLQGKLVTTRSGHTGDVSALSYSTKEHFLSISADDNTARIWTEWRPAYARYAIGFDDFLIVSPDGRFDGTENAINRMHYVRGMETVGLEQLMQRNLFPGLAAERMTDGPLRGDEGLAIATPPEVMILSPSSGAAQPGSVTIAVQARDAGGGVTGVGLYHNGARIGSATRDPGVAGRRNCPAGAQCFEVELIPGTRNVFEATAFALDSTEAKRARIELDVAGTEPTASLYIVAVGINQYQNPRYNLNYGRADARAFVDSVMAGGKSIFKRMVVDTLFDLAATRPAIEASFGKLKQAQPEDVIVFYYAGHGTVDTVGTGTDFFLVPSDVTQMSDPAALTAHGISGRQLHALLEAVPARKRLMIIDACHSGELIETFARRGAAEERALKQLARSSGTFVMSATDSEQFATEVRTLGHGIFTYALLRAMSAGTERSERMVLEIMHVAGKLIPDLSKEHRGQPQYPMIWSAGQNFPLIVR